MSCSRVTTVFMEPITCLLSHGCGQSQRGAGCWGWRWSWDVLVWPHGSGQRVLPRLGWGPPSSPDAAEGHERPLCFGLGETLVAG